MIEALPRDGAQWQGRGIHSDIVSAHAADRLASVPGFQSTALLLLSLSGEVEADAAAFADAGSEPAAVCRHLAQLQTLCARERLPMFVVRNGDIRDTVGRKDFFDALCYLLVWMDRG